MVQAAFDLRSPTKRTIKDDPSPGLGLFTDNGQLFLGPWQWTKDSWTAPDSVLGYISLGDDPKALMTSQEKTELAAALNFNVVQLPGATLAENLANYILGGLADPTGITKVRPLRMGKQGVKLYLGGFGLIWKEAFSNDPLHPNFKAMLDNRHVDYTRLREAGFDLDSLRRWNDFDQKMYQLTDHTILLPDLYKDDGVLKHNTTFLESWPTNQDSIATGQDQPWTEDSGTNLEISSGALRAASTSPTPGVAVCDTALSSSSHSHEATASMGDNSNLVGVSSRMTTGGSVGNPNNCYGGEAFREAPGFFRRSVEWNAGVRTIKANDSTDPGTSFTMSITSRSDDSHDVVVGGFTDTFSDSTHSNLLVGCYLSTENTVGNATLDNHRATDLAKRRRVNFGSGRAVMF